MKQIRISASLVLAVFLSACSTLQQTVDKKNPYYFYKPDTFIGLGDKWFEGTATTKIADSIQIRFQSPVAMDRVEISTCERHIVMKEVNRDGWFGGSGKTLDYTYVPDASEKEGLCPLYIQTFSKDLITSWAIVFFRSSHNLPARMACNGSSIPFAGISACSTKSGLEQRITFTVPVIFESEGPCLIKPVDKMTYKVRTTEIGFCKALFTDGKDKHALILHGYDTVL